MARALATATVTFGLVAIPVKVYVSASSEAISFNQINPATGSRVKQRLVDAGTGDEVDRDKLVKGYEYTKGQYVTFSDEELKKLEAATTKTVDVQEFVAAASIDPIAIEKTYFLGPDKGGDKGYALLAQVLAATESVAVAQWSNRGRVHLVTLAAHKGGLVMRLMFYASEVRDFAEVLDGVATLPISDPERVMAAQLVAHLGKPSYDPSRFSDAYAEKVKRAAEEKATTGAFVLAPAHQSPMILDLFEALKKSLSEARGLPASPAPREAPPQPEPAPSQKKKRSSSKKSA